MRRVINYVCLIFYCIVVSRSNDDKIWTVYPIPLSECSEYIIVLGAFTELSNWR